MRYCCTIEIPIGFQDGVLVEFANELEVSLSCPICKRGGRTIVMFMEEQKSYCTPTRHPFPGHITAIESSKSKQVKPIIWKLKNILTAYYYIEYEFMPFSDPEDFLVNIWRKPTWARVNFTLTCSCGATKIESTQNNLVRPFSKFCSSCGKLLYHEKQTIPRFGSLKKKK